MNQYAMVIDLNRCVGCHACALACRAEWQVPAETGYRRNWVHRMGPKNTPYGLSFTFYPGLCNHCDHPACVPVCPVDPIDHTFTSAKGEKKTMPIRATYKNPFNGAVLIDTPRCIGCGACVEACPYHARYLNETLDDPKADKCTFCVERLAHGEEPACVKTCLTNARIFGDLGDPKSEVYKLVHKEGAKRMTTDVVNIGPNVYYLGKPKDIHLLFQEYAPKVKTWEDAKRQDPNRRDALVAGLRFLKDLGG